MPHADAAPPATGVDADQLTPLAAEALADPRPPSRLLARLHMLDAAGDAAATSLGIALFESLHYRLPAFSDDELPLVASRLYARAGHDDAAFLLAGLAVQLRPRHEPALAALRVAQAARAMTQPPPSAEIAARAEAMLREYDPARPMLYALEAFGDEAGRAPSVALFEAVWPRVRPMGEYWIYYRMCRVYAALGSDAAALLLAAMAIQIEPFGYASKLPSEMLLAHFRASGRLRDAAELCVRRHAVSPEPALLSEGEVAALLAVAGKLLHPPPPDGRRDRQLMQCEIRRPQPWRSYGAGVPMSLVPLLAELNRDPISIADLRDAEVVLDNGAVAVFGPDGTPHIDLSLRCFPPLLRRRIADQADGAGAAEEIETDAAVLISDADPEPNLCHFLLDHATRLELYRRAGVEIGAVTVIGPELRHEYQRVTAERMGVRGYVPVTRRARLRVGRLWVSSTCHNTRHPGHWGATWAVRAVRDLFDLAPRRPARRLLVSRRDSKWRRIDNEARIMHLLEPLGFEAIVPGELSFAEQIAAFRDASHVVAPHGAGLANILWCAPGTHVLEVFHPHYGTWAYAMLNGVLDIDYASLVARDAESDAPDFNDPSLPREITMAHAGRDMWLDPDELERWLIDSGAL